MPEFLTTALCGLLALVALILFSAIKIVKEYERGVVFRFGRIQASRASPIRGW